MKNFLLKVYPSQEKLEKEKQLAWRLAELALDPAPISEKAKEMLINRIIDNSAVAIASLNREPVIHARDQALTQTEEWQTLEELGEFEEEEIEEEYHD